MKLTKKNVEKLKAGEREYRKYFDGYTGFGVKVERSGWKAYFVDYTAPDGRRRRKHIGGYIHITPDEAKSRYMKLKTGVMNGEDPLEEKRHELNKNYPIHELVSIYLDYIRPRKASIEADRRYLTDLALELGEQRRVGDITRIDILAVYNQVVTRGRVTANRFRTSVCSFFNYAVEIGAIDINPAAKIKGLKETPRERVLSDSEMDLLKKSLEDEDPVTRAAFVVMINTGCRQCEILQSGWAEFDLEERWWTIPAHHSKNGKTQVIPINIEAANALSLIRPDDDGGLADRVVIPSPRMSGAPRASLQVAWKRIKDRVGLADDLNMHDIRRTFGLKICLEHGIHVASKLLCHSSIKITERAYAPLGVEQKGKEILRAAVEG